MSRNRIANHSANHSCKRCEVFSDDEFKRFAYLVGVRGQLTKKQVCEQVAELVDVVPMEHSLENSNGSREEDSYEMSEEEKHEKEELRHFVEHYWKQEGKK